MHILAVVTVKDYVSLHRHVRKTFVDILYANEVMPIESLAYLYHCGNRLSVDFFVINSGNCFNFLIISQLGTRVHGSTSDEPLTTFLP